jgi:shikimate kinase
MITNLPPLVVMGVSGCGKSTVGALLGERLGVPFFDGDELSRTNTCPAASWLRSLRRWSRWEPMRRIFP